MRVLKDCLIRSLSSESGPIVISPIRFRFLRGLIWSMRFGSSEGWIPNLDFSPEVFTWINISSLLVRASLSFWARLSESIEWMQSTRSTIFLILFVWRCPIKWSLMSGRL